MRDCQPPFARPPSAVLLLGDPYKILMLFRVKLHPGTASCAALLPPITPITPHLNLKSKLVEHPPITSLELVQVDQPTHVSCLQSRLLVQLTDGSVEHGAVAVRLGHATGRLPQVRHKVGRRALDEQQPVRGFGVEDDGTDDQGT
ncbi:hypothetical protein ACKVWC_011586 [Pyricularia oryzae]